MTTSTALASKKQKTRPKTFGERLLFYIERPEVESPISQIPGLSYEHVGICHADSRRSLVAIFNGKFKAEQARIAVTRRAGLLGGHYHDSAELFFVIFGLALFVVEAVDPPQVREFYALQPGDVLHVPARTAHLAQVTSGTILQTFTEREYTSADKYDHVYPPLRSITEAGLTSAWRLYRRDLAQP